MTLIRVTPPDDSERLAQNLFNNDPSRIRDRESFDLQYDNYLSETPEAIENKRLREDTWIELISKNPNINKKSLHKEAGGKSLKRDLQQTAKTVVTTEKEYKQRGAKNVDLKNYDTVSTNKDGVVVFSRRVNVTKNGRTTTHFEDKKGRKVTPIRKQKQ